jgi:hypothetical protein
MDCLSSSSHHRTHASASERSLSLSLSLCFSSHTPLFPPPPSCDREKRGEVLNLDGRGASGPVPRGKTRQPRHGCGGKRSEPPTPLHLDLAKPPSCLCDAALAHQELPVILSSTSWAVVDGGGWVAASLLSFCNCRPHNLCPGEKGDMSI